jgi:nicotinamide riboside transporter PnuC
MLWSSFLLKKLIIAQLVNQFDSNAARLYTTIFKNTCLWIFHEKDRQIHYNLILISSILFLILGFPSNTLLSDFRTQIWLEILMQIFSYPSHTSSLTSILILGEERVYEL